MLDSAYISAMDCGTLSTSSSFVVDEVGAEAVEGCTCAYSMLGLAVSNRMDAAISSAFLRLLAFLLCRHVRMTCHRDFELRTTEGSKMWPSVDTRRGDATFPLLTGDRSASTEFSGTGAISVPSLSHPVHMNILVVDDLRRVVDSPAVRHICLGDSGLSNIVATCVCVFFTTGVVKASATGAVST